MSARRRRDKDIRITSAGVSPKRLNVIHTHSGADVFAFASLLRLNRNFSSPFSVNFSSCLMVFISRTVYTNRSHTLYISARCTADKIPVNCWSHTTGTRRHTFFQSSELCSLLLCADAYYLLSLPPEQIKGIDVTRLSKIFLIGLPKHLAFCASWIERTKREMTQHTSHDQFCTIIVTEHRIRDNFFRISMIHRLPSNFQLRKLYFCHYLA